MYLGAYGKFHTVLPADWTFDTFEKMVTPTVIGPENLLEAAYAHAGPQFRSANVTSSVAVVVNPSLDRN
jgi:hypothetical protein